MDIRLLEVALYVDDVERSAAFYRALFGFEVIAEDARLWALGIEGREVLLVCHRTKSAQLEAGAHHASGRQHIAFAIPAADIERWSEKLAANAVTIEERRQWPRGGTSLYFRDPDGHLIELASPGVWTIY